jgi:DtxR family transcriptional regulator, Mn-dependent transcriptional regulator
MLKGMGVSEDPSLSRRKNEYIKFLYTRGGGAANTEVAAHFKVDPSTITRTVQTLIREGLVEHLPYKKILLTPEGMEYGVFLLRRHRLLALVFSRYGLSSEEACAQASRSENTVPREVVDAICASLGHPTEGACGPIDHASGCCRECRPPQQERCT